VCILVTRNDVIDGGVTSASASASGGTFDGGAFNAMTVSWLTPVDNRGGFVMSLNGQRHTAHNLTHCDPSFTLSPGAAGMEALLLAVGGCSGRPPTAAGGRGGGAAGVGADKVARCGVPLVAPGGAAAAAPRAPRGSKRKRPVGDDCGGGGGGGDDDSRGDRGGDDACIPAVGGAPAHLVCRVVRALLDGGAAAQGDAGRHTAAGDAAPSAANTTTTSATNSTATVGGGHTLLLCEITAAWVDPRYWHDGKLFGALGPPAALVPGAAAAEGAGDEAHGAAARTVDIVRAETPPPLLCFAGSHRFCSMYVR
jgi:flavin reductase (DIM6/NTAB) family NADH-FMN oxidoreductase RutF